MHSGMRIDRIRMFVRAGIEQPGYFSSRLGKNGGL